MWRILGTILALLGMLGVSLMPSLAGSLTVDDLQGTWKLVEIGSHPMRPNSTMALPEFTVSSESIAGFDGCNNFWGRLDQPGSVGTTRIGCPEGVLKLPLDLSDPLSHLRSGQIHQGRLILPHRNATPSAVFKRLD